jgi:hypothetical protein
MDGSIIYSLDVQQLHELGNGLCNFGWPFIWIVRPDEAHKVSRDLSNTYREKGLIVP